jgi:peptide-methionine (S)-S-oxide reductase
MYFPLYNLLFLCLISLFPSVTQADNPNNPPQQILTAIFAGGCFWCVESDFDHVKGVLSTISGYTGGDTVNPTYSEVTAGGTGHLEAVKVMYDDNIVSYETLLKVFWYSVDPTDDGGQFCDRGDSYKTAIFTRSKDQKKMAEVSKTALEATKILENPIVTKIEMAGPFYPAEDYHQDYYKKKPTRYQFYRFRCGRDGRIRDLWGNNAFWGMEK